MNRWNHTLTRVVSLLISFTMVAALMCSCSTDDNSNSTMAQKGPYDEGIARLQTLAAQDPDDVDVIIKEQRRQNLINSIEERLAPLAEDPSAVWSLFEDYVIIGDSRGADFKFISALDESRNLSVYANTADTFVDIYDDIAAFNPAYIIISVGFCDCLKEQCATLDGFKDYMIPIIEDMQAHFPDALILMNPIFPAIDEGLARHALWSKTKEYDSAIREIAGATGVCYVNCDDVQLTDEDYRDDGIHFYTPFMNRWAIQMIKTIYSAESGLYTFDETYDNASEST